MWCRKPHPKVAPYHVSKSDRPSSLSWAEKKWLQRFSLSEWQLNRVRSFTKGLRQWLLYGDEEEDDECSALAELGVVGIETVGSMLTQSVCFDESQPHCDRFSVDLALIIDPKKSAKLSQVLAHAAFEHSPIGDSTAFADYRKLKVQLLAAFRRRLLRAESGHKQGVACIRPLNDDCAKPILSIHPNANWKFDTWKKGKSDISRIHAFDKHWSIELIPALNSLTIGGDSKSECPRYSLTPSFGKCEAMRLLLGAELFECKWLPAVDNYGDSESLLAAMQWPAILDVQRESDAWRQLRRRAAMALAVLSDGSLKPTTEQWLDACNSNPNLKRALLLLKAWLKSRMILATAHCTDNGAAVRLSFLCQSLLLLMHRSYLIQVWDSPLLVCGKFFELLAAEQCGTLATEPPLSPSLLHQTKRAGHWLPQAKAAETKTSAVSGKRKRTDEKPESGGLRGRRRRARNQAQSDEHSEDLLKRWLSREIKGSARRGTKRIFKRRLVYISSDT